MISNFTISFNPSNETFEKAVEILREFGVIIFEDVILSPDEHFDAIRERFTDTFGDSWEASKLPPQTRPGLFQALCTHLPEMWNIRVNENVALIFKEIYSRFRSREITEFICSMDGLNLRPSSKGPIIGPRSKDWAHIDQLYYEDPFKCFQAQVVLTDTSASFVCTPKSHLIYNDIRDVYRKDSDGRANWFKIPHEIYPDIKSLAAQNYPYWQIPIIAKKGSLIMWTSSLIHSARGFLVNDGSWRCVVYVCYRPKDEFTKKQLKDHQKRFEEQRSTNHWSEKTVTKNPIGQYMGEQKFDPEISEMIRNPTKTGFLDILKSDPTLMSKINKVIGIT